jgi:hypothetical protein
METNIELGAVNSDGIAFGAKNSVFSREIPDLPFSEPITGGKRKSHRNA